MTTLRTQHVKAKLEPAVVAQERKRAAARKAGRKPVSTQKFNAGYDKLKKEFGIRKNARRTTLRQPNIDTALDRRDVLKRSIDAAIRLINARVKELADTFGIKTDVWTTDGKVFYGHLGPAPVRNPKIDYDWTEKDRAAKRKAKMHRSSGKKSVIRRSGGTPRAALKGQRRG